MNRSHLKKHLIVTATLLTWLCGALWLLSQMYEVEIGTVISLAVIALMSKAEMYRDFKKEC